MYVNIVRCARYLHLDREITGDSRLDPLKENNTHVPFVTRNRFHLNLLFVSPIACFS